MRTRKIKLTKGKFAFIDERDYELVKKYKWSVLHKKGLYYAITSVKGKTVYMHRLIMYSKKKQIIDHKDRNTLNNRRRNLRFCNHSDNAANSKVYKSNTSGYRGVYPSRRKKHPWRSTIIHNKKKLGLGNFHYKIDAALAYEETAKSIKGKFANLKFPITIKRSSLLRKIRSANGRIFHVVFIKRTNGEEREMTCRLGVSKNLKSKIPMYNPLRKKLLIVFDMLKRNYRAIPLENVRAIKINHKGYRII